MPLFKRLLGIKLDSDDEPGYSRAESSPAPLEGFSIMLLVRDPSSFYHNLTDEDFCEWARGWSGSPQVLTYEDREAILERIREHNLEQGID